MSNIVVISGRLSEYGPKLRPLPSGKWELNFTLCCDEPGRDGQVYTLYIPVQVYGASCEPLAETLEPHDVVLVTGKLSWTKKATKAGDKSGLAVTTFSVEVLHQAPRTEHEASPEYVTEADVPTMRSEAPEPVPARPAKKGKRRTPGPGWNSQLREPWTPAGQN